MKNKVVIWGTNAQNEKVLIALELQETANKVVVYTIPEPIASEEFITQLNEVWRENKGDVTFPEGHDRRESDLSVTESILPEDLKADRPDMVTRTQTEWHFIVLSDKLHRAYQTELDALRERVAKLTEYDNELWQTLRGFWDKVQEQSRERNLSRNHANTLRDATNQLFDDIKKVRSRAEDVFQTASLAILEEVNAKLADIEERISKGGNKLHIVFDELKALQAQYRNAKMSNEHRNKMFDRIDAAFKAAKERRFGPEANAGSAEDRHNRRMTGLLEAMKRIQDSLKRDEDELEFQRKKVANTEGQLEAQIRQAKIKMIEERLSSKKAQLADMEKTRADVERQIKQAGDRADKRQRMDNAREDAKREIASITTKTAAAAPTENVPATQSMMDVLANVIGESLEDVVDTVKAVATVMSEKAGDVIEEVVERTDAAVEAFTATREEATPAPETAAAEPETAPETPATASADEAALDEPEGATTDETAPAEAEAPKADDEEKTA
jgi:chromosome segregation ATPase